VKRVVVLDLKRDSVPTCLEYDSSKSHHDSSWCRLQREGMGTLEQQPWFELKVHKHEIFFFLLFLQKPKPYGPKIFENRIRFGWDIRLLNISAHIIRSAYAQHGLYMQKLFTFYRWLSMRGNSFLVSSLCDEIVSAYAQHAKNFHKPSRNPPNRTKVKILKKKNFGLAHQKKLVPSMLSHRGNVRTSKFWRKSKEKKRNFVQKFTKGI
jgi:hypothetical protein